MDRETLAFALPVLGTVVGLAVLVAGEALPHAETLVWVGGAICILAVGWLVYLVAKIPDPPDADAH